MYVEINNNSISFAVLFHKTFVKFEWHTMLNVPCLHHAGFCLKGVEPELVKTPLVSYLDVKESPADDG